MSCAICLEELKEPVSTPCGHLHCEACLFSSIEASNHSVEAPCPTCRTPFTLVHPDLRFVPEKYHKFILPSIRRVYYETEEQIKHRQDLLDTVEYLQKKVQGLQEDTGKLMDRAEAAIVASQKHQEGETKARIEAERLRKANAVLKSQVHDLTKKYNEIKGKTKQGDRLDSVSSSSPESSPQVSKRKARQPEHDSALPSSLAQVEDVERRLIMPIPKRPRMAHLTKTRDATPGDDGNNPPPRFKKRDDPPSTRIAGNANPPQRGESSRQVTIPPIVSHTPGSSTYRIIVPRNAGVFAVQLPSSSDSSVSVHLC